MMTDCSDQYMWLDFPGYEWVESELIGWGECTDVLLRQVYSDCSYVYAVTTSGLDIIDIETESKVSYIGIKYGFTTIWGNEECIYLGTVGDGVKYLPKSTISGSISEPADLITSLIDYDFYYRPKDRIKYIHGYDGTLAVVTTSGIDVVNNSINGFKSSFYNTYVTKCFLTSNNQLYYIINDSPSSDGVHKINTVLCDWQTPNESYLVGASFIQEGVTVNDIFVTVNTSETGKDNTLFIATSGGVYVWDEGTSGFDIYYTK